MLNPAQRSALQVVKNFRQREITDLVKNLRIYGPLPEHVVSGTPDLIQPIKLANPFVPKKNPKSGRWHEPKFSLRRQADLVKKAHLSDTLHLLPPGPKKATFELRMRRVKASLPLNAVDTKPVQPNSDKQQQTPTPHETRQARAQVLKAQIDESSALLERLKAEHQELIPRIERDKIHLSDTGKYYLRTYFRLRRNTRLEAEIAKHGPILEAAKKEFAQLRQEAESEAAQEPESVWKLPVTWCGKVAERKVPGTELGTRLYAGKKRMFKGHLWERQQAKRIRRHSILMRDMAARVARYKDYYKKRRPNPLKPPRYSKPPKLPF
jgi:large subunit ribosomal protein L25